jgi:hypothetical protein
LHTDFKTGKLTLDERKFFELSENVKPTENKNHFVVR